VNICGADASKCACSFFKGSDTSTAFPALTKSVNQEINVMTCQVPAGILDAELGTLFVRITDSSGTKNSGLMRVKSQLVLADILGELPQGQIRKVFGYTCARTFLEGSGISGTSIDCNTAGMQLGFLGADYQFYLFQQVDLTVNNFNERGNELSYNGDAATGLTCGLLIKKYSCSNTNVLKFGLAAAATAKFRIGITFTSGPEPLGRQGFYGFAAPTDSNLNCPPGLVKIRPFQAVPSTYTAVASNFVNSDGRLNDNRVEVASSTVANFELRRRAPSAACVAGVCPAPSAGTSVVQSIPYSSLNPFLCAIPQELITDI
jgi:hypothetical protein